ncbi:hypothetical protein GCM10023074_01570 [Microbispora amethystogenes]|uniref:Uncharacterized protein n=1 Tax=Microbispora amethystogenes TaxID=1427754 RepID=A0ABQ4F4Z8_9ACTN|nr:hypothetical protein Mam01_00470 [Microbispora amethystogenes]
MIPGGPRKPRRAARQMSVRHRIDALCSELAGRIVVFPWRPGLEPGHKAVLTVGRNGVAIGRFSPARGELHDAVGPTPTRRGVFGLTVTPEGQHVWLDRPDNVIR